MSEAGKDAIARPEPTGDSLPVRTLARVAPQSVQLAKDHALLGRSAWCGLVCALAAVITGVNLLPPANVGYKVTSQVLVSPKRYVRLQEELNKTVPTSGEATLLDVKLLDDAAGQRLSKPHESQVLIEVSSQWPRRTTTPQLQKWLHTISMLDERAVSHIEAARVQRFARWEVQTREAYLNQHRAALLAQRAWENDGNAGELAGSTAGKYSSNIKLASTSSQPKLKFATLGESTTAATDETTSAAGASPAEQTLELSPAVPSEEPSPTDAFEQQLLDELTNARKIEQNVTGEVASQAAQASGKLTMAAPGRVSAVPERMPRNQVLSIIVLALAVGALGGWVNHRAQSGGTFSAAEVSRNLQLLGLPVLGNVVLPTNDLEGIDGEVGRRFTDMRRWLMQQCLALAELVVLFWCLAILIRMVLDPLWRGLVWENPLSGLARLFVGLP